MDSAPPAPGFVVRTKPSLRNAGLSGEVCRVTPAEGTLHLVGDAAGQLTIDVARTERVRFAKYRRGGGGYGGARSYAARVWLVGEAEPLVLWTRWTRNDPEPAYGTAMRAFARAVAAAHGIGRLERGGSDAEAMTGLLALGVTQMAAFVVFLAVVDDARLLAGLLAALALFSATTIGLYLKLKWPRPVTSFEDLEPWLPDPVRGT